MWTYNNREVTENDASIYYGFVYCIENIQTGKRYIGRKYFTKAATKQVKGKRKKIRKDSGWTEYWGSSQKLLEEIGKQGSQNFKRTILRLCRTRGECNYWEAKLQFEHDVLNAKLENGEPAFYNENILVKFTRRNIGNGGII
jgi:hypothetical protein